MESSLELEDNAIIIDIIRTLHEHQELSRHEIETYSRYETGKRVDIDLIKNDHIFKNNFKLALDYRLIIISRRIDAYSSVVRLYKVNYENHISKKIIYRLKKIKVGFR